MGPARLKQLPEQVKGIPTKSILIIALLVVINAVVWAGVGIVLHFYSYLITPATLSYTLGLRHALDADHISAIDLMTRRLIAAGQRPVSVGTFFSLGHSTIVIITCIAVGATAGALRKRFDNFSYIGGIIGTSISATVLLLLCAGNSWVLWRLIKRMQKVLAAQRNADLQLTEVHDADNNPGDGIVAGNLEHEGGGFLVKIFRGLFRVVDRPWKMFPIGVLFGMGFDTSSEVALLALASLQGSQGTSIWLILIFPLLFTSGMCLLDTTDGALMMALYTSKAASRDHITVLYYSIVLTGITILVSASIGVIQVLAVIQHAATPSGAFWDGVAAIGDHFDIIGGCICGMFLLFGILSVLAYRPWRRKIQRADLTHAGALREPDLVEPSLEVVEQA